MLHLIDEQQLETLAERRDGVDLKALPGSGLPSEAYGAFSVDNAFTAV